MKLREIEAFRAVMRTGSMTVAAKQLHTSQPNVSRAIAQFQRETQLCLFERVGLRVVPTPEAEALLREVERVYVSLTTIREAADRIRAHGVGGLRIGVTPALGMSLVPKALQVFRASRPGVPVLAHTSDSATVCRWTASGYCDFGVVAAVALPHEVDDEMLHRERAVCIVPARHALARRRRLRPKDLAGESFISMPPYDQARQSIDRLFVPETRKLELETSQAATICVMVALGLGVSIVNPRLLQALGMRGIRAVPFDPPIHFEYHVARPRNRPEQALVADFIRALQAVLESTQA